MLSLLCFPNFAESFIAGFALANLAHLRIEIFKALSFWIGWHFDCPLLRNERHLIVGVLVCGSVKHRTDALANSHVVHAPIGIEQNTIAVFGCAV